MSTATQAPGGMRYMQGISVPGSSIDPTTFFANTRRRTSTEQTAAWAGFGAQDTCEIRKSGILSGIIVKFKGSLVIGDATTASTYRWPYDILNALRFTANGQSNLINCSGLKLKARELMASAVLQDSGIAQTIGGAAKTQGTLSTRSELWGVGSGGAVAAGTYPVSLVWYVPVCEDEVDLAGAIYAATSSTDLNVVCIWEQVGSLFTGYTVTPTLSGTLTFQSIKYAIPVVSGAIVLPDLSVFHSMIQSRVTGQLSNGDNEFRITGQGAGKTLLRLFYQVWNNAAPSVIPLVMNDTNFGRQSWRYGDNEMPDEYLDGQVLREVNERTYGGDFGGVWGFGSHEFAKSNALRDSIDEGETSELRLECNITSAPTLVSAAFEYVREEIFAAGAGA
jgi:hypothetical protein